MANAIPKYRISCKKHGELVAETISPPVDYIQLTDGYGRLVAACGLPCPKCLERFLKKQGVHLLKWDEIENT